MFDILPDLVDSLAIDSKVEICYVDIVNVDAVK